MQEAGQSPKINSHHNNVLDDIFWDAYCSGMSKGAKRGRGRPPVGDEAMKQIALRLPLDLLVAIDNLRRDRLDRPDRTVFIRELLAEAVLSRARRKGEGQ